MVGDSATMSAYYCGPKIQIAKKSKTLLQYYLKTTPDVPSKTMGNVTGQGYRFERARVIRDVGSDKSLFVITVKDSFKELEEQATDSPKSAARALHILLVLLKSVL